MTLERPAVHADRVGKARAREHVAGAQHVFADHAARLAGFFLRSQKSFGRINRHECFLGSSVRAARNTFIDIATITPCSCIGTTRQKTERAKAEQPHRSIRALLFWERLRLHSV